jgi:hypothetical protein
LIEKGLIEIVVYFVSGNLHCPVSILAITVDARILHALFCSDMCLFKPENISIEFFFFLIQNSTGLLVSLSSEIILYVVAVSTRLFNLKVTCPITTIYVCLLYILNSRISVNLAF